LIEQCYVWGESHANLPKHNIGKYGNPLKDSPQRTNPPKHNFPNQVVFALYPKDS